MNPFRSFRSFRSPVFAVFGTLAFCSAVFAARPLMAQAPAVYPAPLVAPHPADNPALPPEMDKFAPPLAAASVPAAAPQFGEWSRTASAGQTLTLYGAQLAATAAGNNARYLLFTQSTARNAKLLDAALIHLDEDNRALLRIPSNLPANSACILWASNGAGFGRPALVNTAEAWWVGPDLAASGDTISLYGRNLTYLITGAQASASVDLLPELRPVPANDPPVGAIAAQHFNVRRIAIDRAWVYLKPMAGKGFWANVVGLNPYKVDFTLPDNLAPGTYEVWAHNGHAGNYGWAGPIPLTVTAKTIWNTIVFNVRDFGATPDDGTDDESAIQAAFDAARAVPFSTVYFPAGTYHAGRGFTLPANVRVKGDGKDLSRLAVHPDFVAGASYDGRRYALFFQSDGPFQVQDITLDGNGNINGYLNLLVYQRGAYRGEYDRVRLKANGYNIADWHTARYLTFKDCEFIGQNTFLGSASQVFYQNCAYKGTNDANEMISSWGGTGLSFTGCVAQDLDNSNPNDGAGWAQGRFFVAQGHWGPLNDVYFGNNRTLNLGVRPGFGNQNTGEQFLLEVGATDLTAAPTRIADNVLTFAGAIPGPGSRSVLIVGGRGIGQVRRVLAVDAVAKTVTLDAPFNVAPDAASRITFGRNGDRIAVYNNRFSGKPIHVTQEDHVATTAVYAQSTTRLIIDSNTMTQMRGVVSCFNIFSATGSYLNAWIEVLNNTANGTHWGLIEICNTDQPAPSPRDPVAFAHTYRNNVVRNSVFSGVVVDSDWPADGSPVRNLVYENNTFDAPVGISVRLNAARTYTPGQVYLSGNVLLAPDTQNLLGNLTPAQDNLTDNQPYEMGVKFQTSVSGNVTALRYWKSPLETGSHIGRVWSANGTLLAQAAFTNETASGWQQAKLTAPLPLTLAVAYVVSVNCNAYYSDTMRGFDSAWNYYALTALGGDNGVFGAPGQFPASSYANSNYFRDLVFVKTQ